MISVALCTYNGEKYIRQQLDSILSQTMPVDEIVVADDCSSDTTPQIIDNYCQSYNGVFRLIKNKCNLGFRKNFEIAIANCNGDYIFLSDQDDIWHPDKVKKTISYLNRKKYYGIFTNANLIDGEGIELKGTLFDKLLFRQYIKEKHMYPNLYTTLCLSSNFVTGATMAITKEAKPFILPFKTSEGIYHDSYIAIKLSAISKLGYLDETLISYRIHSSQQIGLSNESKLYRNRRIFDFGSDSIHTYECIVFLFDHRVGFESIANLCELNKSERLFFAKSYIKYFIFVVQRLPFSQKIQAVARFLYVELFVRLRYYKNRLNNRITFL